MFSYAETQRKIFVRLKNISLYILEGKKILLKLMLLALGSIVSSSILSSLENNFFLEGTNVVQKTER